MLDQNTNLYRDSVCKNCGYRIHSVGNEEWKHVKTKTIECQEQYEPSPAAPASFLEKKYGRGTSTCRFCNQTITRPIRDSTCLWRHIGGDTECDTQQVKCVATPTTDIITVDLSKDK